MAPRDEVLLEGLVRITGVSGRLLVEAITIGRTTTVERRIGELVWAPLIVSDENRSTVFVEIPARTAELLGGMVADAAKVALGQPVPDNPPTDPRDDPE